MILSGSSRRLYGFRLCPCRRIAGRKHETPHLSHGIMLYPRGAGIELQAAVWTDRASVMTDRTEEPEWGDPVEIPIEDEIDLHAFLPRDIPSVVEEYLREARAKGFREVRLIHGRGTGTQRAIVRSLLSRLPSVASFRDAPHGGGGWGATIVKLEPLGVVE